jgi:hypothetical protein
MRQNALLSSFLLLLLGLAIVSGCSSTKLVESWSAPGDEIKPIKKILVLALMHDDLHRRVYEDVFSKQISKDGVIGIPGYTVMPNRKDYDEEHEIRAAVKKTGADAALLTRLVAVEKQERYTPPSYRYSPSFGYRNGLYDYYGMSYNAMYTPGYTTVDTVVSLETSVFSTATEKMIWAGSTRSFNPSSANSVITKNVELIIADMKKSGLI